MIKFYPEYGMIKDTITALTYQYNQNQEHQTCKRLGLEKDGIQWIASNFSKPREELCIFFEICDNKRDPFLTYLFVTSGDEMFPCTLQRYRDAYFTVESIHAKLMEYYLSANVESVSLSELRQAITESDYRNTIKLHLIGFLVDPHAYVNSLNTYLDLYYRKVQEYHAKHQHSVEQMADTITLDTVCDFDHQFAVQTEYNKVYTSVSLLATQRYERRGLGFIAAGEDVILCLGPHWEEKLRQDTSKESVDLIFFGKVLSEDNRMKIIQYLLRNQEITISEAVSYLNVSLTAANYHLNMMAESKMLKFRHEGRKIFFSLRKEYFEDVSDFIKDVANRISRRDVF